MKSVAFDGIGSGFQRSRFGGVSTSSNGPERKSPSLMRLNGACIAEGRRRYIQVEKFSARGAVKAVAERTSVYRACGGRCGEFCPSGSAPGSASLLNRLPNPG